MDQKTIASLNFEADYIDLVKKKEKYSSLQKRFRGTDPKNLNQADHNFYSGKHKKPNVGYKEISNSLGISIANYQASQSLPAPIKITEEFLQVINSHKQKIG